MLWEYKRCGRDVWGRPIYAAYCLGQFAGFRYHVGKREREALRMNTYYGAPVGIPEWQYCPSDCVPETILTRFAQNEC